MSGGIPWITLPAGYLGSSFIGAALIACGFDTNASKVASLVLAAFFLLTLWWARREWLSLPQLTLEFVHQLTYPLQDLAVDSRYVWAHHPLLVRRRRRCASILGMCFRIHAHLHWVTEHIDPVHRSYVGSVCRLGHYRYVVYLLITLQNRSNYLHRRYDQKESKWIRCVLFRSNLRLLSLTR